MLIEFSFDFMKIWNLWFRWPLVKLKIFRRILFWVCLLLLCRALIAYTLKILFHFLAHLVLMLLFLLPLFFLQIYQFTILCDIQTFLFGNLELSLLFPNLIAFKRLIRAIRVLYFRLLVLNRTNWIFLLFYESYRVNFDTLMIALIYFEHFILILDSSHK